MRPKLSEIDRKILLEIDIRMFVRDHKVHLKSMSDAMLKYGIYDLILPYKS